MTWSQGNFKQWHVRKEVSAILKIMMNFTCAHAGQKHWQALWHQSCSPQVHGMSLCVDLHTRYCQESCEVLACKCWCQSLQRDVKNLPLSEHEIIQCDCKIVTISQRSHACFLSMPGPYIFNFDYCTFDWYHQVLFVPSILFIICTFYIGIDTIYFLYKILIEIE
jgi:hypothetical protein